MKQSDCVAFCRALADATRQDILKLLLEKGELRVTDIVSAFERSSQPTISHHLKILKQEGLVTSHRSGKEILYALDQDNVQECCGMLSAKFVPANSITVAPAKARKVKA